MQEAYTFPQIKNITVSGRIASGATSLARRLSEVLAWDFWEGGKIDEAFFKAANQDETHTELKSDEYERGFEEKIKHLLQEEKHLVLQSHLAGFDAQGVDGIFKILVVCEDEKGNDKQDIRIDRLVNRKGISVEEAKKNVREREAKNLALWRRLYVNNDPDWIYWDRKYYDFVISTYEHNKEETLRLTLGALGYADARV